MITNTPSRGRCGRAQAWKTTVACIAAALAMSSAVPAHSSTLSTATPGVIARQRLSPSLPPAARGNPVQLPAPSGWPFPESFPMTCGTGRLNAGAAFWTDFVYDDYGAVGVAAQKNPVLSRQPVGTYGYTDPAAANNAADLFRAAVGLHEGITYWRVDLNTLTTPNLPIAMFAITTDPSAEAAATATWPAGAAVRGGSPSRFLLVSSAGAWLLDYVSAIPVAQLGGTHAVDLTSRSLLVRIPQSALGAFGQWRLRLVLGLANATGSGFRQLTSLEGRLDGQPNVYNVGFRTHEQEAPSSNNWRETLQAQQLTAADITPFYIDIDWSELAARRATPEPMPRGFSNRWYASSIELGPGYSTNSGSDIQPVFPGRVQPYAIYLPDTYDSTRPAPLTWLMHSGLSHHNQWARANPAANDEWPLIEQLCRDRGSICVTPLGRSPWGWWYNEAELDVFEVWREVARTYAIDEDRVTIAGLSLGGWAGYKLGLAYPDLFAAVYLMAGPVSCAQVDFGGGTTVSTPTLHDPDQQCVPAAPGGEASGAIGPLVENARWLPYFISHDVEDPLVPITSVVEQVARYRAAGYRFVFEQVVGRGHAGYALDTDFTAGTTYLSRHKRELNPDRLTLRWYPNHAYPGVGTHGAWWIQDLVAHDRNSPAELATVRAEVGSAPRPRPIAVTNTQARTTDLGPVVVEEHFWQQGLQAPLQPIMNLELNGVAAIYVDMLAAGLDASSGAVTVTVTTDSVVNVRFRAGRQVQLQGTNQMTTGQQEVFDVQLAASEHTLIFVPRGRSAF